MSHTERVFKVHDYFVGEEIDAGNYSSIRMAYRKTNYSAVAIRMISKRKLSQFPGAKIILYSEANIVPLLKHPSIVSIYDCIETQGQIFQVMDLMHHGDLVSYMSENTLSIPQKHQICDSILSAIQFLHDHYICHRDIKLDNILLDQNLNAKLTDFGFATFALEKVTGRFGSPGYAAPEILKSQSYDGRKSDIYSLGILLYALFAESLPSTEIDFSAVPADLVPIVKRCLQAVPELRPAISWIRSQPFFSSKFSSSELDLTSPVYPSYPKFSDRISEILDLSKADVKSELEKEGLNKAKIVFHLLTIPNHRAPKFSHSSDILAPPLGFQLYQVKGAESNDVTKALYQFLMQKKFCISSNTLGLKTAVLNTVDADYTIQFECTSLDDDTRVIVTGDKSKCVDVANFLQIEVPKLISVA